MIYCIRHNGIRPGLRYISPAIETLFLEAEKSLAQSPLEQLEEDDEEYEWDD